MMKALVYTGPERVEMMEVASPSIAPGEALLKVHASGICGSDIHGFLGHSERRKPGLILGHEAVATIDKIHAPSLIPLTRAVIRIVNSTHGRSAAELRAATRPAR